MADKSGPTFRSLSQQYRERAEECRTKAQMFRDPKARDEARRFVRYGGGAPFGGEGMAKIHKFGQPITRQVRMLVGLLLNQAFPHRRRMASDP